MKMLRSRCKSRGQVTNYDLLQMLRKLMASQTEVVAELRDLKSQVKKVRAENKAHADFLAEKIKQLEAIIAAGNTGEATPELVAIKDELKAELNDFDADREDVQTPPTEPTTPA